MMFKSHFSGSLWISAHNSRKIAGCESVMSICSRKCSYSKFCYSERLQSFMHEARKKAELNYSALNSNDFVPPVFRSDVVRWFSFGSCNGDASTLRNVRLSIEANPTQAHGIWIEPGYWNVAKVMLKDLKNLRMIYSNKVLNTSAKIEGYTSFNVASDKEQLKRMLELDPDAKVCTGKCSVCNWFCYHATGTNVVIEVQK